MSMIKTQSVIYNTNGRFIFPYYVNKYFNKCYE